MTGYPTRRPRIVLYEGPGAQELAAERRAAILRALLDDGHVLTRVVAGCSVAPPDGGPHLVLGEFEESFAREEGVEWIDVTGLSVEAVRACVADRAGERPPWKPWFPVIDYDRCTNCMQCLTFCLFDVYGVDADHRIQVQNETNCKTDCPACSRVCPEAAIMFPKYAKGPINGDVVRDEDLKREAMKVDVSALLGGDVYATLRARSRTARERFSTERDESKALLERRRCLKKLQRDLDIPDEVLMTLPSAGDIEERARRAREKAERRRRRSRTLQDRERPATSEEWGI